MSVKMMNVRPVAVYVGQGFVGMGVGVGIFCFFPFVGVGVVFVMEMVMTMGDRLMGMEVSMLFPIEKEYPSEHENSRKLVGFGKPLPEN